jgi:addiction module HigA family antidote
MTRALSPVHPGEILAEEFLAPLGVTQYRVAKDTNVPARRINEIVKGKRSITADTALRLARYFGTSELFWLNLQARYDLEMERDRLGARLDAEVHVFQQPIKPVARTANSKYPRSARSAYTKKAK